MSRSPTFFSLIPAGLHCRLNSAIYATKELESRNLSAALLVQVRLLRIPPIYSQKGFLCVSSSLPGMSSYTHWPGSNPATISRSDSTGSISRSDSQRYMEHTCLMMEKRQLFLRSYQFSRKRSLAERLKSLLARAKRVIWFRLRSAAKLRKLVCSRLSRFRKGFYSRRRTRFFVDDGSGGYQSQGGRNRNSSCLY